MRERSLQCLVQPLAAARRYELIFYESTDGDGCEPVWQGRVFPA